MSDYNHESMLDMFFFETMQLLEQLEQTILSSEKSNCYTQNGINEIFRIMHTIKGSSAMMLFDNISVLAHSVEDLFYFLREEKPNDVDYLRLSDLIFQSIDFIKSEIQKIKKGEDLDGDSSAIIKSIKNFLTILKDLHYKTYINRVKEQPVTNNEVQPCNMNTLETIRVPQQRYFKAVIYFDEGCEMENVRAYAVIHNLKNITQEFYYIPSDIIDNDNSIEIIRKDGFRIWFKSVESFEDLHRFFSQIIFLKDLELIELDNDEEFKQFTAESQIAIDTSNFSPIKSPNIDEKLKEMDVVKDMQSISLHQSIISVSVSKLDKLMDLVGELVISEAMVTQNPDIIGLVLDNFQKAARQHRKIINELQDVAMSIRMVPLSTTFQKMNRIIRDMSKKLDKEVKLKIIGEETEVDKNIIEHISDPLMHLIRNSVDHGIESSDERLKKGKPEIGTVTLEAKNAGGDVLIIVKDDGRGLDKQKILKKSRENGLINRPENELADKEIYSSIFLPGFSTNEEVTEFSGRGVGMDVVTKNIEAVGGTVSIDSIPNEGTVVILKIPLTLAIMDGMIIKVGKSIYTIPITNIKESFKANESSVINDPNGNEMIMIRGECYPIVRLHELYNINTEITNISDGIIVMVENEGKGVCIYADELIGQQQIVVKMLPDYIKNFKKIMGVSGCTLLGDGSISLILDIADLLKN